MTAYLRDALGNPTERSLSGAPDEARLFYRYDPAGRLVRISYDYPWALAEGEPRPLVELLYHSMSPVTARPGEKAAGKLYQQKRHNWISFALPEAGGYDPAREADYVVTDTFRYAGTDGACPSTRRAWASTIAPSVCAPRSPPTVSVAGPGSPMRDVCSRTAPGIPSGGST